MTDQFPDFFVVGAAKSGTTALWKYFQSHPEIFVTKKIGEKELGYFSPHYGITDEQKYLSYFKASKENQLAGEVCHAYLSSPESAQLIKSKIPNAKIIIMLRNPIDRAYSLYNWMTINGYENAKNFETALKNEKETNPSSITQRHSFYQNYLYFSSGLYYEQVKRYYDLFPQNTLVLVYDDFKKNQDLTLNKICAFLGIQKYSENFKEKRTNVSHKIRSVPLHYSLLKLKKSKYTRIPILGRIIQLLSVNLLKLNTKNIAPDLLKESTREKLAANYSSDIEKTSKLIGVDLVSRWL